MIEDTLIKRLEKLEQRMQEVFDLQDSLEEKILLAGDPIELRRYKQQAQGLEETYLYLVDRRTQIRTELIKLQNDAEEVLLSSYRRSLKQIETKAFTELESELADLKKLRVGLRG